MVDFFGSDFFAAAGGFRARFFGASAVANLQQKDGFSGDIDRLYVAACYANQGPSMKRVRPAPMGRAFRVLKRTAHLTVQVAERPEKVVPVGGAAAPKRARATKKDKE